MEDQLGLLIIVVIVGFVIVLRYLWVAIDILKLMCGYIQEIRNMTHDTKYPRQNY